MRIGSSISTFRAQRQFSVITKALSRSIARLASGKRIQGAQDDPAGLAVSTRLEAQSRGLKAVTRNIESANLYVNTFNDALSHLSDIVTRMRELATRASNGMLSDSERSALNNEFRNLVADYQVIIDNTNVGTDALLNGNILNKKIQVGTSANDSFNLSFNSAQIKDVFRKDTGSGSFQSITLSDAVTSGWFGTGDINEDGYIDIVDSKISGGNGRFYYYLGRGDGTFARAVTVASVAGATSAVYSRLYDVNNDGHLDLLNTLDNILAVHLGDGEGNFSTPTTFVVNSIVRDVNVGDFNSDGITDIIVGEYTAQTAAIFFGNGNGTFQTRVTRAFSAMPYGIDVIDFNNDTIDDLLISGAANTVVALGNGNGTFAHAQTFGILSSYSDIADINGDGILDFIAGDYANSKTYVYFGNGNGTFTLASSLATITNARGHTLADLNGDGNLDFAVDSDTVGQTAIYYGNGNGTFRFSTSFTTNNSIELEIVDLNNDGAPDIFHTSGGGGVQKIMTMLGVPKLSDATNDLSIATQAEAENMLGILGNAEDAINAAKAVAGAYASRLATTGSYAESQYEAISEANAKLTDADLSEEIAEYTRLEIMQSITTAASAQSNLQLALVLNLLKDPKK